jgi:hypothetical protein
VGDYQTIEAGDTALRGFSLVKRADGSPITSGTVNWYLKALSGTNAGKWWGTDNSWNDNDNDTLNPMTHQTDGHWTVDPGNPFATAGVRFLEYAKESGDLHIPVSRFLTANNTPIADGNKRVDVSKLRGTLQTAGCDLGTRVDTTIGSRLATSSYTAPDNATIEAAIAAINALIDTEIADIRTRVLLALPAFAPDTPGSLITNNATERVIFVSSTGSNSNSGLDPSLPKQTVAGANSATRDGDTICIMGTVDTGNGFVSSKKLHWRGYRGTTAKITSSVDTPLQLKAGTAGSSVKNLTLENTAPTSVSITNSGALRIDSTANIDIENVVATCTGQASHGVYIFYSHGIKLNRVIANGYARGMSIYDSTVESEFGEYTGGESGVYMDCEIVDGRPTDTPGVRYTASSWTSTSERFYGINYTATPIVGSWAGVQAILYECHDNVARHSVKLIQPRFTAIATDAAFPRAVSVVYSGLADLGGAGPSDDSVNNADFVVEGGTVDFLVNNGLGDTFSFRAVDAQTPSQASTFQVTNCKHDESLNDGNVQVINTDVADTNAKTDQMVFTTPNKLDATADVSLSSDNIDDIAAGVAAGIAVSPFNVDKDHTFTFANKNQTTASNIITEPIGFNALLAMDFSDQIPKRTSISSITSATFANIAGTEPTVSSSSPSADRKAAHIMVDATAATAGTYTLSVTVLTADGQTFVRSGRFTVT